MKKIIVALFLFACPAAAEFAEWPSGTPGLLLGDLTLVLQQDGARIDVPGSVTLTEVDAQVGVYVFSGLPDPVGTETFFLTIVDPDGAIWGYRWPARTRAPQSIAWRPAMIQLTGNVVGVGDFGLPVTALFSGFPSDPTTGAATFELTCRGSVVGSGAASITAPAQDEDGTWQAEFTYVLQDGDTDVAATCTGRFLFVSDTLRLSLPARRVLAIEVVP